MQPLLLAIKNSVLRIFSDEIHSDNHVISNCICCVIAEPSIEADENFSRVADDTTINVDAQGPVKFSVWVSFAEIYNETIYDLLRLVFTSDGVVVGVVIRSVKRYDLVKIKPTESEAEH